MELRYADATLTIHLDAIAANYRQIATRIAPAEASAVVKANAYGLGMAEVAERLAKEGCRIFFVAHLDEAVELRAVLPQAKICVFHGLRFGQEDVFIEQNLTPVLNTLAQVERWNQVSALQPSRLHALLHVDTGMNRLGLNISEAEGLGYKPELVRNIEIDYVMSHLACSGQHDHLLNREQLKRFNHLRKLISGTKYSLANSGAALSEACYHFDMVRPGCALYGVWPLKEGASTLAHAVTLKARILQLRTVDRPGSVGYGASTEIKPGTRLAVLPVGYADGYLRHLSSTGAYVSVAGVKAPLVGRVSMDMIVADVSAVPEGKLTMATEAEIIGKNSQTVDELAAKAGTIGYEILTSLGCRYKRVYVG